MATATAPATENRTDEQIQRDVLAELKWDAARPAERDRRRRQGRRRDPDGWVDSYTKGGRPRRRRTAFAA